MSSYRIPVFFSWFSVLYLLMAGLAAAEASQVEWEPDIYPDNQLFPSLLIATATVELPENAFSTWEGNHLGDQQGCVGVNVRGLPVGAKVKVEVKENAFLKASTFIGVVSEGTGNLLIHPKVRYLYDALATVKQAVPLDITIELTVDGVSLGEKTQTVALRPVNDCLFGVVDTDEDGEETSSDYNWLFAAYVNEDHPWVDELLKAALALDVVDSFSGTQSGESDEILRQVFAIWTVLKQRGIKYSDITTNSRSSDEVFSQSVRFLDESLIATQANCVDGSVLLASIFRKIGLEPSLVLVPGHMYLMLPISEDLTIALETTVLGEKDVSDTELSEFPENEISVPKNLKDAWTNFRAAVVMGTEDLTENADRFHDADHADYDPEYQLIDIQQARSFGILPIARPSGPLPGAR